MESGPDSLGVWQPNLSRPLLFLHMWYDVNETLSHNKLFNFVVGPRGTGKTYSAKCKAISRFIKKGEQFIYIRRFDSELKFSQISTFFADVSERFDETLEVKRGGTFACDDEIMGWYIPLSRAAQFKSVAFPKVSLIIFDEFIIDRGLVRYLPNEVETFLEMYSTIARLRDVTVLFLSNAITYVNPYFLYFDLKVPHEAKFYKKEDILVHYVHDSEFTGVAENTRFGKLISDKSYGKYAIKNEFLRDSAAYISTMPEGAICRAVFRVENVDIGFYESKGGTYYFSQKYDKTAPIKVTLDSADSSEDYVTKGNSEASAAVRTALWAFCEHRLCFTDITSKNLMFRYLALGG